MKEIKGKYTSAVLYTTNNNNTAIDDYAVAQLQMLCDNETAERSIIRVMPDVHPGKVGTIGLSMTVTDKLMPNLVGIDIGCGMSMVQVKGKKVEFQKLDTIIREKIPAGFQVRNKAHHMAEQIDLSELRCFKHIREIKALCSLGTLGGGNHFIEVDKDDEGNLYVVVHSGSRQLGKEVTEFYLTAGQRRLEDSGITVPYELTYLEGNLLADYLHDVQIVQQFASLNREIMLSEILKGMKWKAERYCEVIHNYIDKRSEVVALIGNPVLRKGAISAMAGKEVIIPINMRDGIILGTGLGNKEWNCSAPHGAGRILKREDVKTRYTVSAFKTEMKGIYSSCINKDTLDEAPFAYRGIEEIQEAITDTVRIQKVIKPIYNFKAGNKS